MDDVSKVWRNWNVTECSGLEFSCSRYFMFCKLSWRPNFVHILSSYRLFSPIYLLSTRGPIQMIAFWTSSHTSEDSISYCTKWYLQPNPYARKKLETTVQCPGDDLTTARYQSKPLPQRVPPWEKTMHLGPKGIAKNTTCAKYWIAQSKEFFHIVKIKYS